MMAATAVPNRIWHFAAREIRICLSRLNISGGFYPNRMLEPRMGNVREIAENCCDKMAVVRLHWCAV